MKDKAFSMEDIEFFQKNKSLVSRDNSFIKKNSMPDKKHHKKPRVSDEFLSDEDKFKQCTKKPNYYDDSLEEITKSCDDLIIDG